MQINSSPQTQSALRFILYFAKQQAWVFGFQALLCCAWSAKEALFPFFIKIIIDKVYHQHVAGMQLLLPFAALIAIWFTMECAMRIQGFLSLKSFPVFRAEIRSYCFDYLKYQPYSWLNQYKSGELVDCMSQLPLACQAVLETYLLHFVSVIGALLIGIGLLAQTNAVFSVLLIIWLTVHLGVTWYMDPKISKSGVKHAETATHLSGTINDVFSNILTMKWFGRETYETKRFSQHQMEEINQAQSSQKTIEIMRVFQSIIAVIFMAIMLFLTAYYWQKHKLLLGDLTLIPMLSFSALGMVWWLTQELNVFYRQINRINSYLKLIRTGTEVTQDEHLSSINESLSNLTCSNLHFAYADKVIFDSVNLHIAAGSKVGIMGLSGAGKSTFLKLITGILQPSSGNIFIGDNQVNEIHDMFIQNRIAVVPQEPNLFHRSIMENIRYGNLDASDEQIYTVADQAFCHEFIMQLPSGYATIVGDRGEKLSMGQRQRIIIARALLSQAPILIFDEPTASLDKKTEQALLKSLIQVLMNKTFIVISHRRSTLELMDRIIIFDQGKIIADAPVSSHLNLDRHPEVV